jgi:fructokinase
MSPAGRIAVIGEAIADAFVQPSAPAGTLDLRAYPGGGPANTAVALGRLGTPTYFLGRFSAGVLGGLLRGHLAGSGVDLSASVSADGPASLAIAALDEQGRASYDFYLTGATDWQWRAEELSRLPTDVSCVHTGSLALALGPGGPLIEELLAARRPRATVCIDPNVRLSFVDAAVYPAAMARWSGLADIVRLSDEDLAAVAPGLDIEQASGLWHAAGVRLVVLTRGADGATASLDGVPVTVPAVPVEPVDTVGAGDAFTAGLLHMLWYGGHLDDRLARLTAADVARAMEFAARTAARTVAARGADPPWRHELTIMEEATVDQPG